MVTDYTTPSPTSLMYQWGLPALTTAVTFGSTSVLSSYLFKWIESPAQALLSSMTTLAITAIFAGSGAFLGASLGKDTAIAFNTNPAIPFYCTFISMSTLGVILGSIAGRKITHFLGEEITLSSQIKTLSFSAVSTFATMYSAHLISQYNPFNSNL